MELRQQAAQAAPREFIGVLAGHRDGDDLYVAACRVLPNTAADDAHFEVPAPAFAQQEAALRAQGLAWLGFVHSHPTGPPTLSPRDRAQLWRDCLQLLVVGDDVRAFTGTAAGFRELDVVRTPCAASRA